ncbi:heterokaryon incompatibility protein-domain-containing protein [Aspergillus spinulosporus]
MYSPLNPRRREIRLLYLHPGCFKERIKCDLSIHCLNSPHCPHYQALSYTWGDPASAEDPENTILVGGSLFAATKNLVAALRHLRPRSGEPICLWADAVCIDQTNLTERSHQVGMMRQVYTSAKRVVIWLGEADEESDAVMGALHGIATAGVSYFKGEHSHLREDAPNFFFGLAERRPWFTRMWIAQELAVASEDPLVVCGMKAVSWSTLVKAWKVISRELFTEIGMVRPIPRADGDTAERQAPDTGDDLEVLAMLKIDVLNELREAVQRDGGQPLRKLLWISRTSQSTDPRDRVFALLGLMHVAGDADVTEILADYSKPTWAVYADAMEHIFSSGQGPYCLSYLFLPGVDSVSPWTPTVTSSDEEQAYLPSWVPDFSRQTSDSATKPSGIPFQPPANRGASGASADCHNGQRVSDRMLKVEGLWIDTIQETIPFGTSTDEILANLPRIQAMAMQAKELLCRFEQPVAALIEQFKRKEPLWRTLISNKKYMSGYDEAPFAYEDMYLRLMEGPRVTEDEQTEYEKCLVEGLGQKAFFTTTCGLVGTCVPDSRAGDIAVVLFGSPVPFILRQLPAGSNDQSKIYALIGASYVSGIMDGEMVDELYCEDLIDSTTFLIT